MMAPYRDQETKLWVILLRWGTLSPYMYKTREEARRSLKDFHRIQPINYDGAKVRKITMEKE